MWIPLEYVRLVLGPVCRFARLSVSLWHSQRRSDDCTAPHHPALRLESGSRLRCGKSKGARQGTKCATVNRSPWRPSDTLHRRLNNKARAETHLPMRRNADARDAWAQSLDSCHQLASMPCCDSRHPAPYGNCADNCLLALKRPPSA